MRKRSTQSKPENDSLLNFLCNPFLSILQWIIWLVLYFCSRLGIALSHCLKRKSLLIPPAGKQSIGYGTIWEIQQAVQDKDARALADIFAFYASYALLLGMLWLLIIQFIQWLVFPLTIPLVIVALSVFVAWCFGYITQPRLMRVGIFCILFGLTSGIIAIGWPQACSGDHWTWVVIFIAGGIAFLWQAREKSQEPCPGEQV